VVACAGGGGGEDDHDVVGEVVGGGGPAGGLFGVVAAFAEALGVVGGGGSAVGVSGGVVDVFDGGAAVGGATPLVAGDDQLAKVFGEVAAFAVGAGDDAGAFVGVEPADPDGCGVDVVAGPLLCVVRGAALLVAGRLVVLLL